MKQDERITKIRREDFLEYSVYAVMWILTALYILGCVLEGRFGIETLFLLGIMISIRVRGEIRRARVDAIRRENTDRAERAGLAMPEIYENVRDISEAVKEARKNKTPLAGAGWR